MNKDNFDFENEIPETPKKKFSDLDLGLDFDLSFLDDLDESVLEEEPMLEQAPPVKKPAPQLPLQPLDRCRYRWCPYSNIITYFLL